VQPRPCDCSPMCVLRATNPMRVRATRSGDSTFAVASAYLRAEPDGLGLARRVAGYTVLAHDPAVPMVAADYWIHSEPYYRGVVGPVAAALGADAALARLVADPTDAPAERRFEERVAELFAADPRLAALVRGRVDAADDEVYINYFRGTTHRHDVPVIGLERLRTAAEQARSERTASADVDPEILVVIPISDRTGGGRLRNLLACLLALRDQSFPRHRYRVTVVEFDERPRWRPLVEPLVDHYLHVEGHGLFNKSWVLNVGVRHTPGSPRLLCLLDADILVDREFLERNHARFADRELDAQLPHTEMLSMDQPSSDRAIQERCSAGTSEAPLTGVRGLLLRDCPGGCLWVRSEVFHRIGGLDERYRGWGGEDEDMLYRTAMAGALTQFDDVFLHLWHPRPAMRREDGEPFNAHITVGSWTGERGYGELSGPVEFSTIAAAGA